MTTMQIGTAESGPFELSLDLVTARLGILGVSGVGKTNTACVLIEEMARNGQQVIIVDPTGAWWGLRMSADGQGPGIPIVIIGGEHADLPLSAGSGAMLAGIAVEMGLSMVLDLSSLGQPDQRRFVELFARSLFQRKMERKERKPIHLVIDEVDLFAPQRRRRGDESLVEACNNLMRRGRVLGLGVTLITQRSAVVDKDLLSQVGGLVVMRCGAPQDQAAIEAWIKAHGTTEQRDRLMASLASLGVGEAWFFAPSWDDLFKRVRVRMRTTFDSSPTPTPNPVTPAPEPMPLDAALLGDLRARLMAAEPPAPAAGASEQEIARLRDQLGAAQRGIGEVSKAAEAARAEAAEAIKEAQAAKDEARAAIELDQQRRAGARMIIDRLDALRDQIAGIRGALVDLLDEPPSSTAPPLADRPPTKPPPRGAVASTPPADGPAGDLRAGERRMLAVLAQFKDRELTRVQLGTLAGLVPSGSTFSTYLGTLKRDHLAVADDKRKTVSITPAGLAQAANAAVVTRASLVERWGSELRAGERAMLAALLPKPGVMSREQLGKAADIIHTGSTFSTYLGTLKRTGLVVEDKPKKLVRLGPAFEVV